MKKFFFILVLIIFHGYNQLQAQNLAKCKEFAKKGYQLLDTTIFVHDGRYNAITLTEGESIDVYKPFYKDRIYKIIVFADANLPSITFKAINIQRKIIYETKANQNTHVWEFTPDKNQNLVISVDVKKPEGIEESQLKSGCVVVMIGYKKL